MSFITRNILYLVVPLVGFFALILLYCCKKNIADVICCRRYCSQCKHLSHCKKTLEYYEAMCNCNHKKHRSHNCEGTIKQEKKIYKDVIKDQKYFDLFDEQYIEQTNEIQSYKEIPRQQKKIVGTKKVTKYKDVVVGQTEEKYEERGITGYQDQQYEEKNIVDYQDEEYEEKGITDFEDEEYEEKGITGYEDEEYEEEIFDEYEIITNREYVYIRTDSVPKTVTEYYDDVETYTDYENKERYVSKPFFGYRTAYVNGNPITEAYTEYRTEREVDYNVPITKTRSVKKSKLVTKYEDEKIYDWITTETKIPKMKFITKTKSVPVYGMITKTKSVPVYGMITKTKMVDIIKSEPYDIDENIIEMETVVDKIPIYKFIVKQRKKEIGIEKTRQITEKVYDRMGYINVKCPCEINNGRKECKKCSCSKCTKIIDINTPLIIISAK